jgi:Domain of unknown function (DUF5615)
VRLLLDQNLSPRLVRALADLFPGSTHVRDVGLSRATDDAVWNYAAPLGETTEKGLYVDPSATFSQACPSSTRGPFEKREPMPSPEAGDGHGTPSTAPAPLELQ